MAIHGSLRRGLVAVALASAIGLLWSRFGRAQEVGFVEEYALAADRAAALRKVVPGTPDYYFYHCLYYQQTEQFGKSQTILDEWSRKLGKGREWTMMRHRQALLTYDRTPQNTIKYLREQLGLTFSHQAATRAREAASLPSTLDPRVLDRQRIAAPLLSDPRRLDGFTDDALYWLASQRLSAVQRRQLLSRLTRPDVPGLLELVVKDLQADRANRFGQLKIHQYLTLPQLDALRKRLPEVESNAAFVQSYLRRLAPSDDEDRTLESVRLAHLRRMWDFAGTLPAVHNSLKAHVLYHYLQLDVRRGHFDKSLFLSYLKLPRNMPYVNPRYLQDVSRRRFVANLAAAFEPVTGLPAVRNDEALVRMFLEHFFVESTDYREYLPYLRESFVKRIFAETKVLHGLGDAKEWAAMLSPEVFARLQQRVELAFVPHRPTSFGADDPVSLELDIKNVPTLLVKIYVINTWNFYRTHHREVGTGIDLDGLVPNWERKLTYQEPAERRVRRRFEFPELKRPGVYVIDFIGNGKQSRAVVRKGRLSYVATTTPAGQRVTVFDESRRPVPQATVWLGGQLFRPDEEGSVLIPFSARPGPTPIILSHGDLHSLAIFDHQGESYRLAAGIFINRESLIAGREAVVVIRPRLYLNDLPMPVAMLHDVRLVIESHDQRGTPTSTEVPDFKLHDDRDATYTFRVPPRTRKIRVVLRGKVKPLRRSAEEDLTVSQSFEINQIEQTLEAAQLLLAMVDGQYELALWGRNAEPLAGRLIDLEFVHRDFVRPVRVHLQSDSAGKIYLGKLPRIRQLKARVPSLSGASKRSTWRTWELKDDRHSWFQSVHRVEGEVIEIPMPGRGGRIDPADWTLLELRGGLPARDLKDHLAAADALLRIKGLSAGDYRLLHHPSGRFIHMRVTKGPVVAGYVIGKRRQLELRGGDPLQIDRIESTKSKIRVHLVHAGRTARVHIFANRFKPAFDPYRQFAVVRDAEPDTRWLDAYRNAYLEERRIGDEYRYVLDRRDAKKFPGNLLTRPSLLLDPWSLDTTRLQEQKAAAGEALEMEQGHGASGSMRGRRAKRESTRLADHANLDFIAHAPPVWLNLKPNQKGWIEIPLEKLTHHPNLTIVAADADDTLVRSWSLPEPADEWIDLRLTRSLDVKQHFVQTKQVSVLHAGESLTIDDYRSARMQIYDNMPKLFGLYQSLDGSGRLLTFSFLARWGEFDEKRKRELYSKFACNELNVFLFYKDAEFFRSVVAPHLANKAPRTFVEDWLSGGSLERFLDPWSFGRLNAWEQAALAQRTGRADVFTRDRRVVLDEQAAAGLADRLFEAALNADALARDGYLLPKANNARKDKKAGEVAASKSSGLRQGQDARNGVVGGLGGGGWRHGEGRAAAPMSPAASSDAPGRGAGRPPTKSRSGKGHAGRPATGAADRLRFGREVQLVEKMERDLRRRREDADGRLYQPVEQTRIWAETHYYRVPREADGPRVVPWSRFWIDYAQHRGRSGFVSKRIAEAAPTAASALLALAVCDLPWKAPKHEMKLEADRLTLKAAGPVVVFHEQIERAEIPEQVAPILVSQLYFNPAESNAEAAILRDTEVVIGTPYGCRVVLSNPTSKKRTVHVLLQIPQGAMPLKGTRATESRHVSIDPYATVAVEYFFYFPATGSFSHYPAHIAESDRLVAFAPPVTLEAVRQRSRLDRRSWADVARFGTDDEVFQLLESRSLYKVDLGLVAHRLKNRAFYDRLIRLLEQRNVYSDIVWSYSIFHQDVPRIRIYLAHADAFVAACGLALKSPLLVIDPIRRKRYEHIEFRPLIHPRAHVLGRKRRIANQRLYRQYTTFLRWLAESRSLSAARRLELVYYLLLQNRIDEAMKQFARIDRKQVERKVQYDYCSAYLAFYAEDLERARAIADRYTNYPVDRWRNAFAAVAAQLDEIAGASARVVSKEDRRQQQVAAADRQPAVDLRIEGARLRIDYRRVTRATLNFYPMDIELLFSRKPFIQQFGDRFAQVRPAHSQQIEFDSKQHRFDMEIPPKWRDRHMLVEVVAEGMSRSAVYFARSLRVEFAETQGMLRVVDDAAARAMPKVYIKVYARLRNGQTQFYKDGYTDLRGRFDYASLSTDELAHVERFSILVLSEERGAVIRELAPPKS